jgi:hypothetical protein
VALPCDILNETNRGFKLDGGHMNNHAGGLLQHHWHERPIESSGTGSNQAHVPFVIVEPYKSAYGVDDPPTT